MGSRRFFAPDVLDALLRVRAGEPQLGCIVGAEGVPGLYEYLISTEAF